MTAPPPAPAAPPPTAGPLPRAAGTALATAFASLTRLRGAKPIHPRGSVVAATVHRTGAARPWGSAWLDEAGQDAALVRLSRSVGLPGPLPDVLGLALRTRGPGGAHDVLLASTGTGALTRFLLVPRRDAARSGYTSVLPYRSPRGPVLLAAVPAGPWPGAGARFRLLAAPVRGPWEPFGELHLHGPLDGPDAVMDVDPVLGAPPGLAVPAALAAVRGPAYAAARRARGAAGPGGRQPGRVPGGGVPGGGAPTLSGR